MHAACLLVTMGLLLAGDAFAQRSASAPQVPVNTVPSDAGRAVSTAFLLELTNPARTMATYRVGIVNADAGIGMLFSPKGSSPRIEYIAGAGQGTTSRVLVSAAIDQVRNPQANEFRFHVVRKILTLENCPKMSAGFAEFYSGLEVALSAPVNLAGPPPRPEGIQNDAGDNRIQVMVQSATLTLDRLGENMHPLSSVLNQLVGVVASCSEGVPASAVQDYSFSYQQAIMR